MTREQEKSELFRTIWKIANDLRGSVDGWDFKSYVLYTIFYRFISEQITQYINVREPQEDFDFAKLPDDQAEYGRDETVKDLGYFIKPSQLFCNIVARIDDDDNLNETLDNAFNNFVGSAVGTSAEDKLKGLFADYDVNSPKLGATVDERNATLAKVFKSVNALKLDYQAKNIDTFGDAYEFLMKMYASQAGKSGGEFFTPQEVSELLAIIAVNNRQKVNKVYDPACGSGSLLLKVAKHLKDQKTETRFYGQEINITTYNLCRINMFLHDISYKKFDIARGNTLVNPKHWDDQPFDVIVSNPPYSIQWDGDDNPILEQDPRFLAPGVLAPKSKADLAFTMHMLSWLSSQGTAAIVEFPGVLYRGGKEAKIREYLLRNNYIDTVIQLPENLFFGVTIATCIIVLKRSKKDNNVLFIDASKEFVHEGNKNMLSPENIQNIAQMHFDRKEIDHVAKLVPNEELIRNKSNISVSSYVEQEETKEAIDINELNSKIADIVARENSLRIQIDELIKSL